MSATAPASLEERILILAPSARDARMSQTFLNGAGLFAEVCDDLRHLCRLIREGAGAVLVTEECVLSPHIDLLLTLLREQPPWSELPILLLARGGVDSPGAAFAAERLGNVTLLERPIRIPTLLTSVQSALRARRRQYQIREYLVERERTEAALRQSEEQLRFSLQAGHLGSWQVDLRTMEMTCSELCKANFGRPAGSPFTCQELQEAVHPDDRVRMQDAVRAAIQNRADYDIEYRVIWPDGSEHWVMVRGRAEYDAGGSPVRMSGVSLDITERKAVEAELREAARRKDEFLAMLAHELRNPLAPVANAVEVMRARPSRERGEHARDMIQRQMYHMGRLIDDLLDVSRITTGKITLRKQRLRLDEAIRGAAENARQFIQQSGHSLHVTLPPHEICLEADPVRLEQIIANLLNNAAKYTERGGTIQLTADVERGMAVIRVRDTGIGITSDLLPSVFDLFRQGDRGLDRAQGGLGLGLTLVQHLVRLHDGTVEARSEGMGRGSEFVVRLPVSGAESQVPGPKSQVPGPKSQVQGPASQVPGAGSTNTGAVSADFGPGALDRRRKLLVVDDNRDAAESLAELAEIWGYEVRVAFDGLSALQVAREFAPATVLLDIGMPEMDGYEVARRMRADAGAGAAVLVAITGYGRDEDVERARDAGFNFHLVKPVDMAQLRAALGQAKEDLPVA